MKRQSQITSRRPSAREFIDPVCALDARVKRWAPYFSATGSVQQGSPADPEPSAALHELGAAHAVLGPAVRRAEQMEVLGEILEIPRETKEVDGRFVDPLPVASRVGSASAASPEPSRNPAPAAPTPRCPSRRAHPRGSHHVAGVGLAVRDHPLLVCGSRRRRQGGRPTEQLGDRRALTASPRRPAPRGGPRPGLGPGPGAPPRVVPAGQCRPMLAAIDATGAAPDGAARAARGRASPSHPSS